MSRLLCPLLLAALFAPAGAQTPENAIIVIIDGLRHDEGFGAGAAGLPHIWNDLRPLGTVHSSFWDRGWTATTGGHTTILSGVRQIIRNNGGNEQDIRSFDPLVFEYYRDWFGTAESSCGVVVGKTGNVGDIADFSLEPAYGEPLQGFVLGSDLTHDDTLSMPLLWQTMDSTHPRLVLINMADVDTRGHAAVYADYVAAARVADSLIYELYKRIQAIPPYTDTFYRDRTLLIVTSDHGRNDDCHGSFIGHGEWDHGSRQLGFYAFGPGIAAGRTTAGQTGDQIDIVPTVAAMLGFPAPYAEGRVLAELFAAGYLPKPVSLPRVGTRDAANLSSTAGFSRDPDICRDRAGNLHLVWSDDTPGRWSVQFRSSTDDGSTWSSARTLFDYPAEESVAWYARVAADDSLAVSATGWGRHVNRTDSLNPFVADTTFIWYPWIATSTDAGQNWSTTSLLDSSMGSYYAPVAVRNGRVSVAWWAVGQFSWQAPRNGLFFNSRPANGAWMPLPDKTGGQQCIHSALADDGTVQHIVASVWDGSDFDVAYRRSTDNGLTWLDSRVCADPDGAAQYDYDPELVVDSLGFVHVFWARKENTGGRWAVVYGRRDTATGAFDTTRLVSGPADAWQPHAALKGDTIALVWLDYRDGNPEVYYRFSTDRGLTWALPERVSYTTALSQHPRVTAAASGFYCVWQDLASGNWEVYGRSLDLRAARDAAVLRIDAPTGTVESTAAVLPRVTCRNLGAAVLSFNAQVVIRDLLGTAVYDDSISFVDLVPGATATLDLPAWPRPHALGTFTVRCSLACVDDTNPANDTALNVFSVVAPVTGWTEHRMMPTEPSGRTLREGGWLATDEARGIIYAAKGYKTGDFYGYRPDRDSWTPLETIPADSNGRRLHRGAVGVCAGDAVYATTGNSTLSFWRYDINGRYWSAARSVPIGPGRKKVKAGTDMVYAEQRDTGFLFLLKGGTNEFYRFNTVLNTWDSLARAPVGLNARWDRGSWLVEHGGSIFAHKAKYHEFYVYDIGSAAWRDTLTAMPLIGRSLRSRKAGDGSTAALLGPSIFAFKGANTQEFWRYNPATDSWAEMETIPQSGYSGTRRKVKGGADLAAFGGYAVFATKGNRSCELWRYIPTGALPLTGDGVNCPAADLAAPSLSVTPNPLRSGFISVRIGSPAPARASLSIFDLTGRCVLTRILDSSTPRILSLDLGHLAAGSYLVRLTSAGSTRAQKLVLQN